MKTATMLIVLLSHQGYWFGGQEQMVSVQWAISANMPRAQLQWDLMFGKIRVAGDRIAMRADSPASIKLNSPPARARTQMQWLYRVTDGATGKELAAGEQTINLFPPASWSDMGLRMKSKKLFVMDEPNSLPRVLAAAKIDAVRIDDPSSLESAQADIVLVGPNLFPSSTFSEAQILAQAQAGAQVLVCEQKRPSAVGGYPLLRKPMSPRLAWFGHHPLFDGLTEDDLASWAAGVSSSVYALELPADEPVLELAYWPREAAGTSPVPIDALIAVKALGKGRLVYCQFPLCDWSSDPRSQLFLYNTLDYLLTRPEPTLPPSQRLTTRPVQNPAPPSIKID